MTDRLTATALEISRLLWITMKLVRRDLARRLDAAGVALGGLAFGVLRMLQQREQTSSGLSREMQLAPATLVPVVEALERGGFVTRGQDPTDRRREPLALTGRGAAVLARVPRVGKDDSLVRGLSALSDLERRQLRRLLQTLAREMIGGKPARSRTRRGLQHERGRPRVAQASRPELAHSRAARASRHGMARPRSGQPSRRGLTHSRAGGARTPRRR